MVSLLPLMTFLAKLVGWLMQAVAWLVKLTYHASGLGLIVSGISWVGEKLGMGGEEGGPAVSRAEGQPSIPAISDGIVSKGEVFKMDSEDAVHTAAKDGGVLGKALEKGNGGNGPKSIKIELQIDRRKLSEFVVEDVEKLFA